MSRNYAAVGLAKDQPILRQRRRSRRPSAAAVERLQKDYWRFFDLEKFANDWRRGVGVKRSAA